VTTYTFTGAVAYDRLGSSWRTAAGLRSVSVTDPATGLLPANLVQGGVAVTWLTADANSRYSFTCDVPGVVVDFGAGAEALYANEVPGLAIAAGGATNTAIDARMKWAPTTAYTLNQQVISPNGDVVKANVAHTSAGAYATDVAKWVLSTTFAPTNRLRDQSGLLASANGVVGDGTTDDTTAMQALLTSAATFGVPVVLAPLSVVMVDTLTIPSGTVLNLNGATLKKTAATGAVMLNLTGVSNVLIKDGTLDGDKASYATVTEQRHGIFILGSTNITIRGVTSKLNKGDGVYVGLNGSTECQGIVLDRVTCDANHRQGMSVIAVNGLAATSCWFTNTSGTNPQAGVDVEPNTTTTVCKNIRFTGCTFSGNTGAGFLVSLIPARTASQGQITLIGCTADGNTLSGVRLVESEDFQMVGGSASNNTAWGVQHDQNAAKNTKVIGVTVKGNGVHGIGANAAYTNWLVDGCTVESNGAISTGDGLYFAPSAASTNLRLVGNYSGGASQRYGVSLGANATVNMFVANEYVGNGTAARNVSTLVVMDLDFAGQTAAITAPTAPSAAYVQAEATAMKTAVDAIRTTLKNHGITA
jgi:hypothetical protein